MVTLADDTWTSMVFAQFFLMIRMILIQLFNTQSTPSPGPLTGGAVMYEGKLCWSPFTPFKQFLGQTISHVQNVFS